MKATKLIAVIAFATLGFCADSALAQGNEQTEQTPPPAASEESAPTGEETQPYNETVTIDSDSSGAGTAPAEPGFSEQAEKKEKLRVYSGKHDGNNVIADPR